jgi:hypothetical protein
LGRWRTNPGKSMQRFAVYLGRRSDEAERKGSKLG